MRKSWRGALMMGLGLMVAGPQGLHAQSDADDVMQVVESLFDFMRQGDAESMAGLMHADVRLVTTGVRDGEPVARIVGIEGWLQSVAASERELDERIYDARVEVSGGLAYVWTAYDLFVDGEHSHCGVDLFDLVRTSDGWKIINIADTRTREGCRG